jgi:hypothetical protein
MFRPCLQLSQNRHAEIYLPIAVREAWTFPSFTLNQDEIGSQRLGMIFHKH